MKERFKKFTRYLGASSTALICVTSLPLAMNSQTHHQLVNNLEKNNNILNVSDDSSLDKFNAFSSNLDIASSLRKSGSYNESKKIMNSLFDDNYLENRKNEILDKLAATINTFGINSKWSADKIKDEIIKKCGLFLKNYNDKKTEIDNNNDIDVNNNQLLHFLNEESQKINIDVFDSYAAEMQLSSLKNQYKLALHSNNSILSSQKLSLFSSVSNVYEKYFQFAKMNYFSQLDYDWGLLELQNSNSFFNNYIAPLSNTSFDNYSQTMAYHQLGLMTDECISYWTKGLFELNNNGSDFIQYLSDYSPNGTINVSVKNSIIDNNYLTNLFTYNYDQLYQMDLQLPTDVDYSRPSTESGELVDDIGLKVKLPMQEFTAMSGVTYKLGEFRPGYLTHFRIVEADEITDDNLCSLKIEIGLSDSIRDPKNEHILWATDYMKTEPDQYDSLGIKNDPINTFSLTIKNNSQKQYLANKVYYPGWIANVDPADQYDSETDTYYDSSKNQRTHINEILDLNCELNDAGEYILDENNPIYLSGNDVKGIPLPENYQSYGFTEEQNDTIHTNQVLRLKVVDYNSNLNPDQAKEKEKHCLSLKASWCVVSLLSFDKTSSSDLTSVYDIPWSTNKNGESEDYKWVSYAIDQDLLDDINFALAEGGFLYNYIEIQEPALKEFESNPKNKNGSYLSTAETFNKEQIANIAAMSASIAFATVALVLCIATSFFMVHKAFLIAGYTVGIALTVISLGFSIKHIVLYEDSLNKVKNAIKVSKDKETRELIDTVKDDVIKNYEIVNNSKQSFSKKKAASDAIYKVIGVTKTDNEIKIDEARAKQVNSFLEKLQNALNIFSENDWKNLKNKFVDSLINAITNKTCLADSKIAWITIGSMEVGKILYGLYISVVSIYNFAKFLGNIGVGAGETVADAIETVIPVIANEVRDTSEGLNVINEEERVDLFASAGREGAEVQRDTGAADSATGSSICPGMLGSTVGQAVFVVAGTVIGIFDILTSCLVDFEQFHK